MNEPVNEMVRQSFQDELNQLIMLMRSRGLVPSIDVHHDPNSPRMGGYWLTGHVRYANEIYRKDPK